LKNKQILDFFAALIWRSGIEGSMSHLKSDVGTARLRVRGMASVRFTVTLKALGLNILRCAKALNTGFLVRITRFWHQNMLRKPAPYRFVTFRVFYSGKQSYAVHPDQFVFAVSSFKSLRNPNKTHEI
jgi:hypothetical protein